jgi:glycosyltransferase involved in cell wall biosynthesis
LPARRLLVISGAFPPHSSGEAHHALQLSTRLAQRGFDVTVLTTAGAAAAESTPVWPLMRDWSWRDLPVLARAVRSASPDIVLLMYIGWIYNDHPMITYAPTVTRFLAPRARFVTQFENVIGALPGLRGRAGQLAALTAVGAAGGWRVHYRFGTLFRDSHRIIALSEHHRRLLTRPLRSAPEKVVIVPPPPLLILSPDTEGTRERGRQMLGVDQGQFLILYLGYVYPPKGVETLLRAFAILAKERPNARLAIVGGPLKGFEDYARDLQRLPTMLGIEEKVRWAGAYPWDSSDGSTMLRSADVCVMPIDVGVALNNSSIGAAAAHGLPLVATEGEQTESAFRHRENVLLCRPLDATIMAGAIKTVMDDEQLREDLARGARRLAEEWFSWDAALDRTIAAFED